MKNIHNEFYTRAEVAFKFGVSFPTLKKWRDNGILPGYKIGGLVRYKRSEVDNLFNPKKATDANI